MTDSQDLRGGDSQIRPSDAEVAQMLQQTAQQYEQSIQLADLADLSDLPAAHQPRYAWDNPVGLVVTEKLHAKLV